MRHTPKRLKYILPSLPSDTDKLKCTFTFAYHEVELFCQRIPYRETPSLRILLHCLTYKLAAAHRFSTLGRETLHLTNHFNH